MVPQTEVDLWIQCALLNNNYNNLICGIDLLQILLYNTIVFR